MGVDTCRGGQSHAGEYTLKLRVLEGGVAALDAIYLTLEAGQPAELNLPR